MRSSIPFYSTLALFFLSFVPLASIPAQETALQGAWSRKTLQDGQEVTQILMVAGGFFTWAEYLSADSEFLMTKGGSWTMNDKNLSFQYEFHSATPETVGSTEGFQATASQKKLTLQTPGGEKTKWSNLDAGVSTPLTGAWLFSGRRRDGELQRRDTNIPRKTMKILTGARFQWIAYNTESGEFSGTGGGTYTAKDGKYTENILFFSRDKNRVGASLEFDFEVQGEDWRHSGFSSSGNPMYEIWTKRH